MRPDLIALKLIFDELEIDASKQTFRNRIRMQKAIYLAQRVAFDLGYRFGWYLRGPYSPALAQDYYALDEALRRGPASFEGKRLRPEFADKLKNVLPLMRVPDSVPLPDEQWLELLASLDYLLRVRKMSRDEAFNKIAQAKPELHPYVNEAYEVLRSHSLVK